MKIVKLNPVTRCDNGCCNRLATYAVCREGTPITDSLRLCEDCLKSIVALGSELFSDNSQNKVTATVTKRCGNRKEKNYVDANMGNRS